MRPQLPHRILEGRRRDPRRNLRHTSPFSLPPPPPSASVSESRVCVWFFDASVWVAEEITAGTEVTFDYKFKTFGKAQPCLCGAPSCRLLILPPPPPPPPPRFPCPDPPVPTPFSPPPSPPAVAPPPPTTPTPTPCNVVTGGAALQGHPYKMRRFKTSSVSGLLRS